MVDDFSGYSYAIDDPYTNIDYQGLNFLSVIGSVASTTKEVVKYKELAEVVFVFKIAKTTTKSVSLGMKIGKFALKALEIGADFIPGVSGAKNIYKGIRDGNGWQVAGGALELVIDGATLGTGSLIKGGLKTLAKQGAVQFFEGESKYLIKRELRLVTQGSAEKYIGCFVAGTMIWGVDSSLAIEHIRPGDSVFAFSESEQRIVKRVVSTSYSRNVIQLTVVEFGAEKIFTTAEHPFYVNKVWIEAGKLKVGDLLVTGKGNKFPVTAIRVIDTAVKVFNITVAEDHDYYVGGSKVLVHNNNPCAQVSKIVTKSGLKYSDELLKTAQKAYPKLAGKSQLHHITPKYLGGAADGPLVKLDAAYHQQITNAFRKEWGYGTKKPNAAQLEAIMKKVYSQFPLPK